jgi:ribosome maturation factor RimP
MSTVWDVVQKIVKGQGLELFDLEIPRGPQGGTLRVYISRGEVVDTSDDTQSQSGVRHQDCVAVSRQILDHPEIETLIPGNVLIEVSSPGINRKLTRPEHYLGARGERIKLNLTEPFQERRVLRGLLVEVAPDALKLDLEDGLGMSEVPRSIVDRARVDFDFDSSNARK